MHTALHSRALPKLFLFFTFIKMNFLNLNFSEQIISATSTRHLGPGKPRDGKFSIIMYYTACMGSGWGGLQPEKTARIFGFMYQNCDTQSSPRLWMAFNYGQKPNILCFVAKFVLTWITRTRGGVTNGDKEEGGGNDTPQKLWTDPIKCIIRPRIPWHVIVGHVLPKVSSKWPEMAKLTRTQPAPLMGSTL